MYGRAMAALCLHPRLKISLYLKYRRIVSTALVSIIRLPYSAKTKGLRIEALPNSERTQAALILFSISKFSINK
jgi:hypothetical protein